MISTGSEADHMYSFDRHSLRTERVVRPLKYIKTQVLASFLFCGRSIFIPVHSLNALTNEQRLFQIVLFVALRARLEEQV